MYTFKCATCGKEMQTTRKEKMRRTCGAACLEQYYRIRKGNQTFLTRPANRDLHPDGMVRLVAAIVAAARSDVLRYSPETQVRQDAERFFLSDYFTGLTDMDGKAVLDQLRRIYDKRHKQKRSKRV